MSTTGRRINPVVVTAGGPQAPRAARRRPRIVAYLGGPVGTAGAVVLGIWVICAIAGVALAPHDPFATNPQAKLQPPSSAHWLGTDQLGRDVFSRLLVGARDILTVAPLATLLGTVWGTMLGLLAGYFRGVVDAVLSRIMDAFLALPLVILAMMALVALGPSKWTVVIVIGILFAPIIARTVRAAVISERELEYVAAAQLRNESAVRIMFLEILPNVLGPILVEFTIRLGYAIFASATLSFLGFGIQPPSPDWGLQIFEGYALMSAGIWWPTLFPALAIASIVVGVNLLSDGISRAVRA